MNDETNNVIDENIETPKKKSKWILGLGVFAVIAIIAGVAVFANGGEWFKGSTFDMPKVTMPAIQIPTLPTGDSSTLHDSDSVDYVGTTD
ncbi:hypothetical protein KKD70_01915, partial [Patescibacteria group bacterium]|nr:hypothetical protein [Patescibacteria group bacterium]